MLVQRWSWGERGMIAEEVEAAAGRCDRHIAALAALQHFGSYWELSGHEADLAGLTRITRR
jgi:hypothetical protein